MNAGNRVPVLFIEARVAHGGDVQVLIDMLKTLDLQRFAPLVACVANGPVATRDDLPAGIELLTLGFGYSNGGGARAKAESLARTIRTLRREVAHRHIRAVHSNNTRRALTVAVALKTLLPRQVHLIYHAHCGPQDGIAHRAGLALTSQVWAVSKFIADEYRRAGVPASKLTVIPNAYDFEAPWPAPDRAVRDRLGIPTGAPLAVLVGRLSPNKGQHLAIGALSESACPLDTHLILVGDDSIADSNEGYRQRLVELARQSGLSERVHMVGFSPDPRPYYVAADAVLIPSSTEGFGLTALEAAAARRPIVATPAGGLAEVLGDTGGLQLAQNDPESLAALLANAFAGRQYPSPDAVHARLADAYGLPGFAERVERGLLALA